MYRTHIANVDRDYTTGRKIINHYEVIEEIGRGVHGKVKLARDLDNNQNVAIKIVPRFSKKRRLGRITQNVSPFEKTKREIAILKKIRHPNVVALLEVIDDPDYKKIYLCLEHVECGEVIWRKKGLPAICAYERQRIEREMRGEPMSEEEEQYLKTIENRYNIKELKRAHMAEKMGTQGEGDPWSLEFGADGRQSEGEGADVGVGSYQSNSPFPHMSAPNSQAPSRTQSMKSISGAAMDSPPPLPDAEDETPGRLHDTITSISALEGTMWGAYDDTQFRQRSPSMADSIISHMSSLDFNAHSHDPYADDYSYVPCFTIDEARRAFRDVVLGLQYLHYQGIVHRDIKPANLLWTKEHSVKISDFGVSYFGRPMRDFEPDDTVSESEAQDFDDELELSKTVGTPAFFAPELCYTDLDSGSPPKITEKIDIWSLGVTLYCMIFARIPFLAEDEFRMFRKIATEKVYIPNRRLRPVDPSTSPKTPSLYNRQNEAPFRDDQALVYEDVDENLRDLLDKMLTKDPRKRIDLRGVKQHPWILADMPNQIGWIDDTDPFRQTEGRKIQLTDKDLHDAVVPLTLLERARSTIKKIHSKFSSGRSSDRTNDSTIGARRRATSSAASSTGDIPASATASAIPSIPHLRELRRKSIRGDSDYFATVRDHSHSQSDHPLTYSVVASPDETPSVANDSTSRNPVAVGNSKSGQILEVNTDFNGNEEVAERQTPTAPQHRFTRHRHRHSQSLSYASQALIDNVNESQTAPTTPTLSAAYSPSRSSRKGRDPVASPDDSIRSQSVDRALVFHSQDKRAEPKVALSTFSVGGNFEQPKKLQQMRSMDLRRAVGESPIPSPLLFSPQAISQYQYGQHKSDVTLDKFQTVINDHQPQHKSETTLDKFQTVVKFDERPVTAHRVKDLESKTPPPRSYGPSTSTEESFARAREAQRRREKLEYEEQQNQQDLQPAAEIEQAVASCPPSPDDEECPADGPSRVSTFGSRLSSKSSSADAIAMPSVSSSAVTSPVSYTTSASHKDLADAVTFQSDPSLPALLSGASSVSADPEGDFLHVPGSVSRGSVLESTESLTPPALGKEPVSGFPLEDASLDDPDSVRVGPAPIDSEDCGDDEDSDSEEEGLVMMSRRPKKSGSIKESPKASLRSRRRGTNASVGSTDTAKKISSED